MLGGMEVISGLGMCELCFGGPNGVEPAAATVGVERTCRGTLAAEGAGVEAASDLASFFLLRSSVIFVDKLPVSFVAAISRMRWILSFNNLHRSLISSEVSSIEWLGVLFALSVSSS